MKIFNEFHVIWYQRETNKVSLIGHPLGCLNWTMVSLIGQVDKCINVDRAFEIDVPITNILQDTLSTNTHRYVFSAQMIRNSIVQIHKLD